MLTTLKEILQAARKQRYAVPAFDCVEDVMVRAILETAELQRAPVILMCLTRDVEGDGVIYLSRLIRGAARHHSVPVALHLDHASHIDQVKRAIDYGFTSVMIDGSKLPFKENVRVTREVVDAASPYGVSVEGELGHVGGMDLDATKCAESVLTETDEVTRFVEETGVDALAVSIGTSHGVYQSLPQLSIDRLKQLNEVSPVPLVLHGGSGTPDDQIQESVRNGICKLNIYADCRIALGRGLRLAAAALERDDPMPEQIFRPMKEAVADVVAEKIQLLFANNQVPNPGTTQ